MTIKRPMFPPTRRDFINTVAALPIAASAPATAAPSRDAELIELGARFEPLLDQYYIAQRRWSPLLAQAHAENTREFGDPASRNYEYTQEIHAAFADRCEWLGVCKAADLCSAIHDEMKPLANAINAAPVNSLEGLRAKALVAFWEVAPLAAGYTEFSFDDAYPFQQLFAAVAEVCGLKGKIAETGYQMPDIGIAYDESEES